MPESIVENWSKSQEPVQIGELSLYPVQHNGRLISIQRGQGEVFFLDDGNGARWVLKKFYNGRCPDASYLQTVGKILPNHEAFFSGRERKILLGGALKKTRGCFYTRALRDWLQGALLMPRVQGVDWAGLAEEIREQERELKADDRLVVSRNLIEVVQLLEARECAHRDLSAGNVFVEPDSWRVHLIDFDSVFHPDFRMPDSTTSGTNGYTAPFIYENGKANPSCSWRVHADRFALGMLIVEILIVDSGAPLGADGGVFTQEELCARAGSGIEYAREKLAASFPDALDLFNKTIRSRGFEHYPSPTEWHRVCRQNSNESSIPFLEKLGWGILTTLSGSRRSFVAALPAIELPPDPWAETAVKTVPTLPPDPWS